LQCRVFSRVKRVAGGKTLKVDVRVCGIVVEDVVISGDFFAHPEEAVEEMERVLRGKTLREAPSVIESFKGLVELVGVSLEDLKSMFEELASEVERS